MKIIYIHIKKEVPLLCQMQTEMGIIRVLSLFQTTSQILTPRSKHVLRLSPEQWFPTHSPTPSWTPALASGLKIHIVLGII